MMDDEYPLVICYIAIENHHSKSCFFPIQDDDLAQLCVITRGCIDGKKHVLLCKMKNMPMSTWNVQSRNDGDAHLETNSD